MLIASGRVVFVDQQDLELCSKYTWHISSNGYVTTNIPAGKYKQRKLLLHRLIMQPKAGDTVDHINGNKLDNRRCNLRVCSQSQNSAARNLPPGTSGFRGVTRHGKNWRAQITINYARVNLGTFKTAEEAARAYDNAARQYFGEFARPNFSEEKSDKLD